jgi:hypothetical protein
VESPLDSEDEKLVEARGRSLMNFTTESSKRCAYATSRR